MRIDDWRRNTLIVIFVSAPRAFTRKDVKWYENVLRATAPLGANSAQ